MNGRSWTEVELCKWSAHIKKALKNWEREKLGKRQGRSHMHPVTSTLHVTLLPLHSFSLVPWAWELREKTSLHILKGVLLMAIFKTVTFFTFRQVLVKIPESLFSFITMLWCLYYKMAKQQGWWVRQGTCFGTQTYYVSKSWSQTSLPHFSFGVD